MRCNGLLVQKAQDKKSGKNRVSEVLYASSRKDVSQRLVIFTIMTIALLATSHI